LWIGQGTGEYVSLTEPARERRDPQAYVDRLLETHPVGTADQCAERLARTAARTGTRRLLLMVEGTGDGNLTLDTVARLGTDIAPRLKSASVCP
jgi:alkanesulfonate monooxygenase SsuD/methylene tetrahydromethanopterin reductase-like flavin-dependent oxidoreductase (luciferase family)